MQVVSKYINFDSNYLKDLVKQLLEKLGKSRTRTTVAVFSSLAFATTVYQLVQLNFSNLALKIMFLIQVT